MCLSSFWSLLSVRIGSCSVIKVGLFLVAFMLQVLPVMAVEYAPSYPSVPLKFSFNGSYSFNANPQDACSVAYGGLPLSPSSSVSKATYKLDGPQNVKASHNCYVDYKTSPSIVKNAVVTWHCPYGGQPNNVPTNAMCVSVPMGSGPPPPPPTGCMFPAGTPMRFGLWTGWGPLGASQGDGSQLPEWPRASAFCNAEGAPTIEACYSIPEGGREHFYCVFNGISAGTVADGTYNANNAPVEPPAGTDPPRTDMPPLPAPTGGSTPGQCPKGSVMAGYNSSGTPMCVGSGTAPPTGSTPPAPPKTVASSTTANPDGSSTVTTTTTTTNRDGSTTIVRDIVTTPPAGSTAPVSTTQTKETTKTATGAPGAETKPEEVNFCKQNPTLSICRESSVSGTCGQIACMGDAIQCATLRAAAAMQCKQQADEDALKATAQHALGLAAASGTDPLADTLPTVKNASVVDMKAIDQSGWIGGGQAFSDVSFSLQGHTVTVPLNEWSGYLVGLRYALMVVALLVSFRMLSGVILRD